MNLTHALDYIKTTHGDIGVDLTPDLVYISGPMRGMPDLNRKTFAEVENTLNAKGWLTHNPAQPYETGPLDADVTRRNVEALLGSDAICLIPGWRNSEGARFEAECARALGLGFYLAKPTGAGTWSIESYDAANLGVEGIDQEARRLVYGERAQDYGHPSENWGRIAALWSAILGTSVTIEQSLLCMAAVKLARLAKDPAHHDSQVDTIGYILALARTQESE